MTKEAPEQTAKENGLATADDFKRAAGSRLAAPDSVFLPKLGKVVLLRKPSPLWFVFRGRLPQSLAVRAVPGAALDVPAGNAAEELLTLADWILTLLREVFVEPRVAVDPGNPGEGEISPDWLDLEDVNFIIRWAYGEVATDGSKAFSDNSDLAAFRRGSGPAAAGARGGNLVVPAQ
jgi:hypothetical protein